MPLPAIVHTAPNVLVRRGIPIFSEQLDPLHLLSFPRSEKQSYALSSCNPSSWRCYRAQAQATSPPNPPSPANTEMGLFVRRALFLSPGVSRDEVKEDNVLPGSNIVIGPYAGHSQVKQVEFVKSNARVKECPKDDLPEFAFLGRSNFGKSSLINTLVRKKDFALTSKKPGFVDLHYEDRPVGEYLDSCGPRGKTQLINHFLVNKSWYIVDLPGYGYANAPETTRMDWSVFTKGYFLNRDTLVNVLLLVDASIPPQKIDLDCANWLGRNNIPMTFVFTKCDKRKSAEQRPDENIKNFQEIIVKAYKDPPPWIMTSSVTNLGRDELLLHMSQMRNYWNN